MKTARASNKFLIDLPKSMEAAEGLRNGADLQFSGNKDFPVHFYAITDEKASQTTMGVNFTTEEIYFLETEHIATQNSETRRSLPKATSVQYLSCVKGEVQAKSNPKDLTYHVCVCEGGARFYRLVVFGESEIMKKEQKPVNDIISTFREWTEFQAQSAGE